MIAKAKKKNIIGGSLLAGTLIIAGALIAAPITGGTSLIAGAAGFTATALTVGTVTISTAELAILVGGSVASLALLKGYGKIKINPDGSVEIVKN